MTRTLCFSCYRSPVSMLRAFVDVCSCGRPDVWPGRLALLDFGRAFVHTNPRSPPRLLVGCVAGRFAYSIDKRNRRLSARVNARLHAGRNGIGRDGCARGLPTDVLLRPPANRSTAGTGEAPLPRRCSVLGMAVGLRGRRCTAGTRLPDAFSQDPSVRARPVCPRPFLLSSLAPCLFCICYFAVPLIPIFTPSYASLHSAVQRVVVSNSLLIIFPFHLCRCARANANANACGARRGRSRPPEPGTGPRPQAGGDSDKPKLADSAADLPVRLTAPTSTASTPTQALEMCIRRALTRQLGSPIRSSHLQLPDVKAAVALHGPVSRPHMWIWMWTWTWTRTQDVRGLFGCCCVDRRRHVVPPYGRRGAVAAA
ncbi:hypothetical protein C8Q80DRAFT_783139 [Daedaleopsis nitida]|nr:hypothetical protein C8Q80DRAFT_783139 [Daedaleopsis nitida]